MSELACAVNFPSWPRSGREQVGSRGQRFPDRGFFCQTHYSMAGIGCVDDLGHAVGKSPVRNPLTGYVLWVRDYGGAAASVLAPWRGTSGARAYGQSGFVCGFTSTPSRQRCYTRPAKVPTFRARELRKSPTEAEKAAWRLLRDRRLGAKFRRQFGIENGVLDFYCFEHRLAIELDGGVHSQIDQMRRDAAKEDHLRTLGIRLLRIPNAMVLGHPDEFVRTVVDAMRAVKEKGKK